MEQPLIHVSARHFLSAAAHLLSEPRDDDSIPISARASRVGEIELMKHQQEAIIRIESAFNLFGGALLADDTGLGKTFVALAIAARQIEKASSNILVVAPAVIRSMWLQSAERASVAIKFASVESLSGAKGGQGVAITGIDCDLLIVDEAHHLRNSLTKRFARIASISPRARVLLLTATPVHNSAMDLRNVLSIFLGSRAKDLSAYDLSRIVIRREQGDLLTGPALPAIVHGTAPVIPQRDDILNAILALPPHVPPADSGDAGVLLTFTLVRQWASSFAALERALSRRLTHGVAMLSSLENDVMPTAADLRSWCTSPEEVQLPLFGLFSRGSEVPEGKNSQPLLPLQQDLAPLRSSVERHIQGVRALLRSVRQSLHDIDGARWQALRDIQTAHRDEKVLCFSQFAETARAMFKWSRDSGRSALLTSSGATIASGSITRDELVRMFAPLANGARSDPRCKIDLLFSTDVLSEGVNLQDASVLVHLDIPWTPVRLSQRVGRIARTGSRAASVTVYTFPPPASAEALLKMERRLSAKLSVASRTVGVSGTVLPLLHLGVPASESVPQADARMRSVLGRLRDDSCNKIVDGALIIASVECECGVDFLAFIQHGANARLLAGVHDGMDPDPATLLKVLEMVSAAGAIEKPSHHAMDSALVANAIKTARSWISAQQANQIAGLSIAPYARARTKLLRRIDLLSQRAPPHTRPRLHELTSRARRIAAAPLGYGAERVLAQLADAQMPDDAWLRAIDSFIQTRSVTRGDNETIKLLGILLLR